MKWWKVLGVASLVGVAATGVVVVRGQRQRAAYTPEEIRARLHARVDGVSETDPNDPGGDGPFA